MKKKVLITGANGFIGRTCIRPLLDKGFEVHTVDIGEHCQELPGVVSHSADLLNPSHIEELMARINPSHLLHFAWCTEPGRYWTSSLNLNWVAASLTLLQHFTSFGGRRAVMAGSCAEYDWRYGYCSETITPLNPATLYGKCKHSVRLMAEEFAGNTGISFAWGRIFFVYGPGEHPNRLVPYVINALRRDESAECTSGDQIRDFLHVKDAGAAFVDLLDSQIEGAVNVASGQPVNLKSIITAIAEQFNKLNLLKLGMKPKQDGEPDVILADTKRLFNEVGWVPKIKLNDGLVDTITWWLKQ